MGPPPPLPLARGDGQQAAVSYKIAGFDLRVMTAGDLQRIKSYYYGMISLNDKGCVANLKTRAEKISAVLGIRSGRDPEQATDELRLARDVVLR
jgi:hypothetical protein